MCRKRRPEMQRAKITNGALPSPPSSLSSPLPSVLLPCVYTDVLTARCHPSRPPASRSPPGVHPQQVAALHPTPDKCALSAILRPVAETGSFRRERSRFPFASHVRGMYIPQTSRRIKIIYSKTHLFKGAK